MLPYHKGSSRVRKLVEMKLSLSATFLHNNDNVISINGQVQGCSSVVSKLISRDSNDVSRSIEPIHRQDASSVCVSASDGGQESAANSNAIEAVREDVDIADAVAILVHNLDVKVGHLVSYECETQQ